MNYYFLRDRYSSADRAENADDNDDGDDQMATRIRHQQLQAAGRYWARLEEGLSRFLKGGDPRNQFGV